MEELSMFLLGILSGERGMRRKKERKKKVAKEKNGSQRQKAKYSEDITQEQGQKGGAGDEGSEGGAFGITSRNHN